MGRQSGRRRRAPASAAAVPSPEGARCDVEQVTLGPDGTLYIGGDGIYALRSDGTVRWHFDPGARALPSPAPGSPGSGQPGSLPEPAVGARAKLRFQ